MILRVEGPTGVLVPDLEGDLTEEGLVRALPREAARVVFHELFFAWGTEGSSRSPAEPRGRRRRCRSAPGFLADRR
ncbi:hypothetical protein [Streptomyces sp. NPDC058157]|uniref:hypothetical protein n=1 Tax=Streptomyces sp. NPDC058157 TaxID=3346360 RepID=UPI0036F0ABA7